MLYCAIHIGDVLALVRGSESPQPHLGRQTATRDVTHCTSRGRGATTTIAPLKVVGVVDARLHNLQGVPVEALVARRTEHHGTALRPLDSHTTIRARLGILREQGHGGLVLVLACMLGGIALLSLIGITRRAGVVLTHTATPGCA